MTPGDPKLMVKQDCDPEYRDNYLCRCRDHVETHHHCCECGIAIHRTTSVCGECVCEED